MRIWRRTIVISLSVGAVALCSAAQGANLVVDSGYDQNGNPGSSSPYFFNSGSASYETGYICVQNSGVMHHTGGTLTFSGFLYLNFAGVNATTGTYNLGGSAVLSVPSIYIARGGTGTFNQTGGTNTVTSSLTIAQANVSGSYNLSGGTLSAPVEYIGDYGAATFTQNGGTNIVNGTLHLGNHAGPGYLSSGTYNLNGGVLQANSIVRGTESNSIVATMNFNGGTLRAGADNNAWIPNGLNLYVAMGGVTVDTNGHNITVHSGLSQHPTIPTTYTNGLTKVGDGTLRLTNSSGFDAFRGPVNINRGVISVSLDGQLGYPGNQLNFNGGTLRVASSISSFAYPVNSTTFNGGLDIAEAGHTFTAVPLVGSNLTKAGLGTLTLTGSNTFSGTVNVSAGTLNFGSGATFSSTATRVASGATFDPAALPSATLSVASGQSLGGGGTVSGSVAIQGGGNLAPGSSVGTITVGSLTLASGSPAAALSYEFNGAPPTVTNDFTNVTGALTIDGGRVYLYIEDTTSPFNHAGSYDLIGYGTLAGSAVDPVTHNVALSVANPVEGFTYTFTDDPVRKRIVLTIVQTPQAPQFTSADHTTFQVGVAGSFTVTTTGFPTPTITASPPPPPPAGVTFTDNGDGTATISGTPQAGTGGVYQFTLTASNGVGSNATQTFTLTVNEPPAITSANAATFTAGTAGSFTVTATGYPPPTLSRSGTLPAGVTFDTSTGVLSGTPQAGTGGSYPLTFTASNGIGSDAVQSFTLTVNEAPAITSANTTTFQPGVPGSFTVTATGYPPPTLSQSGTLPPGVTFDSATGVLSGTTTAVGAYPITFTANNGVGSAAVQNFTLIVNTAPNAATSPNPVTTNQNVSVQITLTGTDPEDQALTFAVIDTVNHGTLTNFSAVDCSGANVCTQTVTYTPLSNYRGPDSFIFTVSDGFTESAPFEVSINVTVPVLAVSQTILSSTSGVDAGDEVRYQITAAHASGSTATAHNLNVTDDMPAALVNISIVSAAVSDGVNSRDVSGALALSSASDLVTTGDIDLAIDTNGSSDETLTIVLAGKVRDQVAPGSFIANGVRVAWQNSAGIGASGSPVFKAAPTINIPAVFSVTKSVLSPASSQAPIASTVTYQLSTSVIEGATANLQYVDTLPPNMSYVAGSAQVSNANGTSVAGLNAGVSGQTLTIAISSVVNPGNTDDASTIDTDAFLLTYQAVVNYGATVGEVLTNDVDASAQDVPADNNNTASVTVTNAAPTVAGANNPTGINEDETTNAGTLVSVLIAGHVTEPDSGQEQGIAVTAVDNANGAWEYSLDGGANWTAFGSPTAAAARLLAADADNRVRLVPASNFNGTVDPGVTFRAWDRTSGADGGTADTATNGGSTAFSSATAAAKVTVAAVNDAPTFTKGADETVNEDSGAQTVSGWATNVSAGPADESGQTLSFTVTHDNNALFAAQPAITSAGELSYTPAADANGSATVTVTLKDNGGTAIGGRDTSAAETFIITVSSVNDAPSFSKGADQTVNEDSGAQTVTEWATNISPGPSNEAAQTVSFTVSNDNNGLFSTQPSVDSSGTLTYTPATNANGSATITVTATDDGGTDNGGDDDSAAETFTITVTAVNDAPTVTKGSDQSVDEDAGEQSVPNWASDISAGPAGESGQTLSFTLTNDNNSLFSTQPAISPDGTLTYTPAADTSGSATVTVTLSDDGGTDNDGKNSSTQTFTITVGEANDAPVLDNSGNMSLGAIEEDVAVANNAGTLVSDVIASAGGDRITDADDGAVEGIAVTAVDDSNGDWQFTTDNGTNWTPFVAPIAAEARLLAADSATRVRFLPKSDFTGTVDPGLTFRAWDGSDGKASGSTTDVTTNGGTSAFSSAVETASISVGAVNDAPTFTEGGDQTVNEDAGAQTVSGWATNISAGPADESSQTLTFTVTNDNNSLFAAQPTINPTGTLTYTPAADANGTAIVTVTLVDDGGTANGGQDSSASQTFAITVNAVNDAPLFTKGPDQTVVEDSGPQTVSGWATDISRGPADESAQTLGFTTTNNNNSLFAAQPTITSSGTLTYTPASNASGSATVNVTLKDSGGTANGGQDSSATQSFTITVTPAATPSPSPSPTSSPSPTASPSPSVSPSPSASPSKSLNISTRGRVGTGERALIAGTIISGNAAKKVIFRAVGPSLADDDISDALADPILELYGPNGSLITTNDNWKDAQQSDIEASGLAPDDEREAAIVATLMPDTYTAILRGKDNSEGVALAEVYDLDPASDSKLANISTRGFVETEENVVIGGFLLGGSDGTSDVIIRALGPSLRDSGVAGFLADPTLELRDGNGALVRSNDDWAQDPEAAKITANGLEPEESVESAIAITLPPGDYTAIVAGKNNTFGVGLVEIYNLK